MNMTDKKFIRDDRTTGNYKDMGDGTHAEVVVAQGGGTFNKKFREAFERFSPDVWTITRSGAGDIVAVDGNAGGASYLVVSLDPTAPGTETWIETVGRFTMPIDASFGAHMSQRTVGQEFSLEIVSDEEPIANFHDIAIASIQHTGTTLVVNTAVPHGLRIGTRIGIRNVPDSRLNYSAAVVAATPNPSSFTVTSGPYGNLPNVTAGPYNNAGFVYARSAMGGSPNGTAMLFENGSATQASFYVKSEGGEPTVIGGTLGGNHSTTVANTASAQAVNAALNYAFRPNSEYRLSLFADRLQWADVAIDSLGQTTNRANLVQVVPNPDKLYKLRIRATNNKSLSVPMARIVRVTKTGSTTATVETDVPHGLTTADQVHVHGIRDFNNFPAVGAAAVTSVINDTTFTAVMGGAVTASSVGGWVGRNNAQQPVQGSVSQFVQSISRTAGIVQAVSNANWAGLFIGDYVNLCGVRDAASSLGLDGAYRVRDVQTVNLFLEPIGTTPTGADIAATNCGGGVLKRTDLRLSFVRLFDFERVRVEAMSRPQGDVSNGFPVIIQGNPGVAQSGNWNVGQTGAWNVVVAGQGAEDTTAAGNAVRTGGRVRTSHPTSFAGNDAADVTMTTAAALVVRPYSVPEADWNASLALTATAAAALQTAAGAGLKRHITALQAINTGAALVDLILLDGTTERWRLPLPVNVPVVVDLPNGLVVTANTALNANLSAAGTVRLNAQGYTAP